MLAEGTIAPDFQLQGWRLAAALQERPVLLAFFKVSCPTCQFAFPFLQRLADAASPSSPYLIAISQDDADGSAWFGKNLGIRLKTLLDEKPGYQVSNLYRLTNVPTLYLIEPDHKISLAFSGFSKAHFEGLGNLFGGSPFKAGEQVPLLRPG